MKSKRNFFFSIPFLKFNENYFAFTAILTFYLMNKLKYSDDQATIQGHFFNSAVYFMPIFGGLVSDVYLGNFWTVFMLSIVYAVGSTVISIGAIPKIGVSMSGTLFAGLAFIAIGSGGIKPCVSAFGGDQFKLPEQSRQMERFFSIFYMSINLGSLISTGLTPYLRADVHCFDEDSCYSLAFGVPAILMVLSIGKNFRKK